MAFTKYSASARSRALHQALSHAGFDLAQVAGLDAYRLRHRATNVSVDIPSYELYAQPGADTVQGLIAGLIRLAHRALMQQAAEVTLVEKVGQARRELGGGDAAP